MNLKFLPIGSLCKIGTDSSCLLIIGYHQNDRDYVGVNYPEGIAENKIVRYFDHAEITDLVSLGYKDEMWNAYNEKKLLSVNNVSIKETEQNMGLQFDENGIVVADNLQVTVSAPISNIGLQFDEGGIVVADNLQVSVSTPISNMGLQYDENGIVVADNSQVSVSTPISNMDLLYDENGIVVADNSQVSVSTPVSNMGLQYDESGIIVAETIQKPEQNMGLQFDENGVVIADWTTVPVPEQPKYRFDENGIVVADETLPDVGVQSYQYDENGIVVGDWTTVPGLAKSNYVYDSNGVIVSDGNSEVVVNTMSANDFEQPAVTEEIADIQFDENGMVITNEEPVNELGNNLNSEETVQIPDEFPSDNESSEAGTTEVKEEKKKKGFFGFGK